MSIDWSDPDTPDAIQPTGIANNDSFGNSMSLNQAGDLAIFGAAGDDIDVSNTGAGAAYIFERTGNNSWSQRGDKIVPTTRTAGDSFGSSVAMNAAGDYVAISSPFYYQSEPTVSNAGRIYVFKYNGSSWDEKSVILTHSNAGAGDALGQYSVAINDAGTVIVAGAGDYNSNDGRAIVFTTSNDWSTFSEYTIDPPSSGNAGRFGRALSLNDDGDILVVGELLYAGESETETGQIHIYSVTTATNWSSPTTVNSIQAATPIDSSLFGESVAINRNGTHIVVGASGGSKVYVYNYGAPWTETILPGNSYPSGAGVAIDDDGEYIVAGAPGQNTNAGGFSIWSRSDSTWSFEVDEAAPAGSADFDSLGINVAMDGSGQYIATGGFMRDTGGENRGEGFIYYSAQTGGSGGDPHIISLCQPKKMVDLPHGHGQYFQYLNYKTEREEISTNIMTWEVKLGNPSGNKLSEEVLDYIAQTRTYLRYVAFNYKNLKNPGRSETVVVDLETLEVVNHYRQDLLWHCQLPKLDLKPKTIKLTDIYPTKKLKVIKCNTKGNPERLITIPTLNGQLKFKIGYVPTHPTFRTYISLKSYPQDIRENGSGLLINHENYQKITQLCDLPEYVVNEEMNMGDLVLTK